MTQLLVAAVLATCPKGFDEVETACVVARATDTPSPTVVYFHGMLPGSTDWSNVRELQLLGAEAKKRGAALVALRGEQGLCSWAPDVKEHWCWPNDLRQLAAVGRTLERLGRVLTKTNVERGRAPVFAGFSNGGYFTSLIASDTKAIAQGYVVLHAGNVVGERFPSERAKPVLIIGATLDTIQLPVARRLHALLGEAGWPAKLSVREGVHEVTEADAKAIFDFAAEVTVAGRDRAP